MNVLILGASGQLGYDFQRLFNEKNIKYIATDYKDLDVTDFKAVKKYVEARNFTHIINCSAYNNVDKAEADSDACYLLNAYTPEFLAKLSKEQGVVFMTYSTDFVFDGKKNTPYKETDKPNPLSVYGKSKLKGEELVLENNNKAYVVRTSWVFGVANNNFNKQVLGWSKGRDKLSLVDDQVSSPTYSRDLAKYSWMLVDKGSPGLYHLSNSGECSKYKQGEYILCKSNWNGELTTAKTKDFNLAAKRAKYSKLDSEKLENTIGEKIPNWQNAIDRFLKEL